MLRLRGFPANTIDMYEMPSLIKYSVVRYGARRRFISGAAVSRELAGMFVTCALHSFCCSACSFEGSTAVKVFVLLTEFAIAGYRFEVIEVARGKFKRSSHA